MCAYKDTRMLHTYNLRTRTSRPARTDALLCMCYDNLPPELLITLAISAGIRRKLHYRLRSHNRT